LAKNGQEGIDAVVREHPDLVLLDINLPDMSGFDACRLIRVSFAGPILMVTVRNSVRDKIDALDAGADDYIVKPFAMAELLAHVRAALRRSSAEQPLPKIESSELTVDLEMRMVNVRGNSVHLTPKEFDVLRLLVTQQGRPVTHRKILQIVWGPEYGEETELVRVVIRQLRRKIEKNPAHPRYILTEPWVGYMFQLPPDMAENGLSAKSDLAARTAPLLMLAFLMVTAGELLLVESTQFTSALKHRPPEEKGFFRSLLDPLVCLFGEQCEQILQRPGERRCSWVGVGRPWGRGPDLAAGTLACRINPGGGCFLVDGRQRRVLPRNHAMPVLYRQSIRRPYADQQSAALHAIAPKG